MKNRIPHFVYSEFAAAIATSMYNVHGRLHNRDCFHHFRCSTCYLKGLLDSQIKIDSWGIENGWIPQTLLTIVQINATEPVVLRRVTIAMLSYGKHCKIRYKFWAVHWPASPAKRYYYGHKLFGKEFRKTKNGFKKESLSFFLDCEHLRNMHSL